MKRSAAGEDAHDKAINLFEGFSIAFVFISIVGRTERAMAPNCVELADAFSARGSHRSDSR